MGISIKGKGGGTRVTIDGKHVTEKMELKEEWIINHMTERSISEYNSLTKKDDYFIYNTNENRQSRIGKISFEGYSEEFMVLNQYGSYGDSHMFTIIDDNIYASDDHNEGTLMKYNLQKKEETQIRITTKELFSFKKELYTLKNGYSYQTDLYKVNLKDNSLTLIIKDCSFGKANNRRQFMTYETKDALYFLQPATLLSIDCDDSSPLYKFDGKKIIAFPTSVSLHNDVFTDPIIFNGKMLFFENRTVREYDPDNMRSSYIFDPETESFTDIGKRYKNPFGIQISGGKVYGISSYPNSYNTQVRDYVHLYDLEKMYRKEN